MLRTFVSLFGQPSWRLALAPKASLAHLQNRKIEVEISIFFIFFFLYIFYTRETWYICILQIFLQANQQWFALEKKGTKFESISH